MPREKRKTRKQKQRKTPNWKGTSKYARKQQQKRERAAKEAGLPITASWVDIRNANKKGGEK